MTDRSSRHALVHEPSEPETPHADFGPSDSGELVGERSRTATVRPIAEQETATATPRDGTGPATSLRPTVGDGDGPIRPASAGDRYGDYEIVEEIGRGGMGIVYRARQRGLGRDVALKTIKASRFVEAEVRRFRDEATALAALQHPGIVPIYDLGDHLGQHYYTMRLIAGGSLVDRRKDFRRDHWATARVIAEVARAVHHAHTIGILHRDLKPSNVLLDHDGRPVVADFGLAHRFKPDGEGAEHDPESVGVAGTAVYMSPEQAAPHGPRLTTAVDIYSLGALLYALLTGRPPFLGRSSTETLRLILEQPVRSPREFTPEVDRDLEAICLKCLEKEPLRRYPTASELANDLDRYLDGRPVRARPATVGLVARKWVGRRPALAGAILAAVLALALGVAGIAVAWRVAVRNAAEARHRTYTARILHAEHAVADANYAVAAGLLDATRPDPRRPGEDFRGFEWHYLRRLLDLDLATLDDHGRPVAAVDYAPGGRRLASGGIDGLVLIREAGTGRVLRRLRHDGALSGLAYAPDGRLLATAGGGLLRLWDAGTGEPGPAVNTGDPRITAVAVGPGGRLVATAGADGMVRVWEAGTLAERHVLEGHGAAVQQLSFAPDGQLASCAFDGTVRIWDAEAGRFLRTIEIPDQAVRAVAFAPDGRTVASAADDGLVRLHDAGDGRLLRTLAAQHFLSGLAFDVEGRRLAAGGREQSVLIWDLDGPERDPLILRGHRDTVNSLAFRPDGQRLATAGRDGTVRLWDAADDRATAALAPEAGTFATALDPALGTVAAGGVDGIVRLLDVEAGRVLRTFPSHNGPIVAVAYSPDGRRIATAGNDRIIVIRDLSGGGEPLRLRGHAQAPLALVFSPDGRRIASGGEDGVVRLWDASTGAAIAVSLAPATVRALAFPPDGRRVLVGTIDPSQTRSELVPIDARTGAVGRPVAVEGVLRDLAIAPGGRIAAIGGNDGVGRLYDLRTGRLRHVLRGHKDSILSVAFDRDGRRLASSSADETARVWDVGLGQELLTLRRAEGPLLDVAFGPGDRFLATATLDGTVRLWLADRPAPGTATTPRR